MDSAIFFVSSYCCIAPALGAINRYEMREKYNIIGFDKHQDMKKHFEGKENKELFGKKDGHGLIGV